MILIDTHVLAWLYQDDPRHLPVAVQDRLNREELGVSPFTQLELNYLHEIGRLRPSGNEVLGELGPRLELVVLDVSASAVCGAAASLTWTRDPFDRLITAHATILGVALITKDRSIRQHYSLAWWSD